MQIARLVAFTLVAGTSFFLGREQGKLEIVSILRTQETNHQLKVCAIPKTGQRVLGEWIWGELVFKKFPKTFNDPRINNREEVCIAGNREQLSNDSSSK